MKRLFSVLVVIFVGLRVTTADFKQVALDRHNELRAIHHSPPLTMNDQGVIKFATSYAKKMLTVGFRHSNGKYGENIYWSSNSSMTDEEAVLDAINDWYAEGKLYNYRRAKFSSQTGHFTQVVWKDSKNLGISVSRSKSKGVYVCADYDPRGNVQGKFKENVLAP